MTRTIAEERDAIAATLAAVLPEDTNIYARWPNNIDVPAILIRPSRRIMDEFGRPLRAYEIDVLTIQNDEEEAQMQLDLYLDETGEYSIIEALQSNPTLNDTVGNSHVEGWRDYDGRRTEVVPYIGATIDLVVYT